MRRWGLSWLGLVLGLSLALGSGGPAAWAAPKPAYAPAPNPSTAEPKSPSCTNSRLGRTSAVLKSTSRPK